MIVSKTRNKSNLCWLRVCVLVFAMIILPLSVTYAQNYKANDIERHFEDWIGSVSKRLKTAVEAHKLSEEDAWGKWHHFKENELAPKLKAAVKAGKIHAKTAREIWRELEKAEDNEKLKSAVAKSEISEEEARAKWSEFNKEDKNRRGASNETLSRKYRAIEARIRAAVKTGKMTREAATKKLGSLRKRFRLNDIEKSPTHATIDAIKERIWAGVKAGRITETQAMERWQGYLKRLRQREPNERES